MRTLGFILMLIGAWFVLSILFLSFLCLLKWVGKKKQPKVRFNSSPYNICDGNGYERLGDEDVEDILLEGFPLPEGAEDFDLRGFIIDPITGKVTGSWIR